MPDVASDLITASGVDELVDALGRWLEAGLHGRGYIWAGARRALERTDGVRDEVMSFYSSQKNDATRSMRIMLESLEVGDMRLLDWRANNPELTVERPESARSIVCFTVFNELGRTPANWWIDFSDADRRVGRATSLLDAIQEMALPWFEESAWSGGGFEMISNRTIAKSAIDLLEYSFVIGGSSGATEFLNQVYEVVDMRAFEEGVHMASSGAKPIWKSGQAIGWSSRTLGLV